MEGYLAWSQILTRTYYATLLEKGKQNLKAKHERVHKDSTPSHTSAVVMTAIHEFGCVPLIIPDPVQFEIPFSFLAKKKCLVCIWD